MYPLLNLANKAGYLPSWPEPETDGQDYQCGRKRRGFCNPNPSGNAGVTSGTHATHRA